MPQEFIDIYDQSGNLTGATKARGDVREEGEYALVCGLWIINPKGQALIQKRAMVKRSSPGKWDITGGYASAGEDSVTACLREVYEEIGLSLRSEDITLMQRNFDKRAIYDDYIAFSDWDISKAVLQPNEVSEIRWASLDEVVCMYHDGLFIYSDLAELMKACGYIASAISM